MKKLKILFLVNEKFPTNRVRINIFFEIYLSKLNEKIFWIFQTEDHQNKYFKRGKMK